MIQRKEERGEVTNVTNLDIKKPAEAGFSI